MCFHHVMSMSVINLISIIENKSYIWISCYIKVISYVRSEFLQLLLSYMYGWISIWCLKAWALKSFFVCVYALELYLAYFSISNLLHLSFETSQNEPFVEVVVDFLPSILHKQKSKSYCMGRLPDLYFEEFFG